MKKAPPQPKQSTGYLDGDFLPSSDDGDSDQEVVAREEKVVDMSQQVRQPSSNNFVDRMLQHSDTGRRYPLQLPPHDSVLCC